MRQQARLTEAERGVRFARAYRDARDSLTRLGDATARRLDALTVELRRDIVDRLAALPPDAPFAARIIPEIRRSLDASLAALRRQGAAEIGQGMADAFNLGGGVTARALVAAGAQIAVPSISPALLASLTGTFDSVFAETTGRLADDIMREIRRSAAALEPASRTMLRIEELLKTARLVRPGVRPRIGFAFQAEEIVRTELGRAYSNAQQAAAEQIAEAIPGLKKRWVTSPRNTRREHQEVEERYAVRGPTGPIPVKDRYEVPDRSRVGTSRYFTFRGVVARVKPYARAGRVVVDRMLFPRDPAGSPGNVINCTCTSLEVVPDLERAVDRAAGIIRGGRET